MSKTTTLRGWLKMGGLLIAIIFFIMFYLITINTTSTKGYFLRESMKELDEVQFRHNVTAFQLAIVQRQLRNKVNIDFVGERNPKLAKQKSPIIHLKPGSSSGSSQE